MHPDTDELCYVVSGHMEVSVMTDNGEESVDLPAGTVYAIPKGTGISQRRSNRPLSSA